MNDDVVDPTAQLATLEAETEAIEMAVKAMAERVDAAKDNERADARHLQFLNDNLRTARSEATRIAGECFTTIRANDSAALAAACQNWFQPRDLCEFITGAVTNTYAVLGQHRIQTLTEELGYAQEVLRRAKHEEKKTELELLCLVGDAAERQGGISVSSTALDECRRRTAAAARAAEDAQTALTDALARQRDLRAQSHGTVSFNNPS